MALIQNRKHKETNTLFHVKMGWETQTYPPFVKQTNYYDRCQLRVTESTYSGQYWFKQRAPGTVGAQPPWAAAQWFTEVLKLADRFILLSWEPHLMRNLEVIAIMGSAVSEGEGGSPFSWLQELPVSACAGNQMNTAHWVAWFAPQKLDFGVTPGLWVPTLPGKPVSRLPADLLTSREWVRDSSKIIVQSPWLSGVKSRQQSWCNVSFCRALLTRKDERCTGWWSCASRAGNLEVRSPDASASPGRSLI